MALMQCRSCSTKFAVGLLRCPQCGAMSELYAAPEEVIEAEQEANMPKISVEGGPSNALGEPVETEASSAEAVDTSAEVEEQPHVESETSGGTSDATDEASGHDEDAADGVDPETAVEKDPEPAPAPKLATKTAAKKAVPPKG